MTKENLHNNFIIRQYRRGDFEEILHLWELTDLSHPVRGDNELIIEESIRMGGSLLILEEKVTGVKCGTSWMTFDGRRIHLHHFGILPEFQVHGLSEILLKDSLSFVKKKGCQVKLEVNKLNERAINLYKKFGFKALGDYDVYIIRDPSKLSG